MLEATLVRDLTTQAVFLLSSNNRRKTARSRWYVRLVILDN
jgi:hypothetical protein